MALEYRILGPLEVIRDGEPVAITAAKERAVLLCLLLSEGQPVSPGRLIDAVWGEKPPVTAPKLVQLYVSHLRRWLGPSAIATSPAGYRIQIATEALDSAAFSALVVVGQNMLARGSESRALAIFDDALALWRGAEVEGGATPDAFSVEARRLEAARVECLEERLALLVRLGEHERALPELTVLCAGEPLRERARGLLMLALYRSGRQSEALASFRELSKALREELGLEPSEELRALEASILRHDPELAAAPQGRTRAAAALPIPTTELVGRSNERRVLRRLIERTEIRLISLVGAGGSGKTRLALALASDLAESFSDGVVLVELAAVRDPDAVVPAIAKALAVPESHAGSPIEAIAAATRGRELLLVLDNFEQVASAATNLVRLLEASSRLTMLVTSRRVLHVSGEHVFPVEPLPEDDAFALFVARASALDVTVTILPPEVAAIRTICRRLDGLPLAIELAAAQTRLLRPRQLAERLDAALTVLVGGPRDLPARQQTLRDTLNWSVGLLDPEERSTLGDLSVFAGGWSLAAAEEVVGADLHRLGALVDHSLLRHVFDGDEPRFEMLETIREFASERLDERRATLERAHADHFVRVVETCELAGPEQPHALQRIDRDRGNLQLALAYAAASPDVTLELRLVGALWRFWWLRGELVEGLTRLEHALERSDSPGGQLVAQVCRGAAGIAWNLGQAALAHDLAQRGLQEATASGDLVVAMACHTVLGLLARDDYAFDQARDHFRQSGAIATELERPRDVATAKLNLGSVAFASEDYVTAQSLWEDVLGYNRAEAIDEGVALCLLNLGLIAYRQERLDAAHALFSEAERLFSGLGFREHQAHALQGMAAVNPAVGGAAEHAARLLGQAARMLEATGSGQSTFDTSLAEAAEAHARAQLGDAAFAEAFATGKETTNVDSHHNAG
ncbi:MAG: winged helix-turn-helix domain-containing protein [Actinobacteria bacterium]|nr:winged helix-turn-helix domain-containing protein [Actinomycetota bacterium]